MTDPHAFDPVFQSHPSITAVLHTASPFFQAKSDPESELLVPALKGTQNVLKSIKTHAPQVTHVVITSSFAAIADPDRLKDHSAVFSEDTWSQISWQDACSDFEKSYRGSKTFAEQEFWRMIKEEEGVNFIGTTVNPPLVFGPVLQQVSDIGALNTSNAILYKSILQAKKPGQGKENVEQKEGEEDSKNAADTTDTTDYTAWTHTYVDVRDVALAHVLPIESSTPSAFANKRLFTVGGYFSLQTILDVANAKLPTLLGGRIPVGKPGTGLQNVKNVYQVDNHKTNKLLFGTEDGERNGYHTFEETVVDTLKSLVELEQKLDAEKK